MSEQKISVQITADINGFKRQLTQAKQAMQRLDKDFDRSGRDMRRAFDKTESALDKQTNKIEKNFSNLSKDVKRSMDKLSKLRPEVEVELQDNISQGIALVTRNLNRLDGMNADARVELEDQATREISRVLSDLNRLDGQRANPRVSLEGNADREINDIRSDLNRLDGMRATPKVSLEGNADREINGIRSDLNRLDGMKVTPRADLEGGADRAVNALRGDLNKIDGIKATPRADLEGSADRQINSVISDMNRLGSLRALPTVSLGGSGLRDVSRFEAALNGINGRTYTAKARVDSNAPSNGSSNNSNTFSSGPFQLVSGSNLIVAGASKSVKKGLDDVDSELERTQKALLKGFKIKMQGGDFAGFSEELGKSMDIMRHLREYGAEYDGNVQKTIKRLLKMNSTLDDIKKRADRLGETPIIELDINDRKVLNDIKKIEKAYYRFMDGADDEIAPLDFRLSKGALRDLSSVKDELKNLTRQVPRLEDALEDVEDQAKETKSSLREAFEMKELKKKRIEIDVDFAKDLTQDYREVLKMIDRLEREDVEIDVDISKAKAEIREIARAYELFISKAKTGAKTSISATADFSAINKIKKAMASLGDETVELKAIDQASDKIAQIKSALKSIVDRKVKAELDIGPASQAIQSLRGKLNGLSDSMQDAFQGGLDSVSDMAGAIPGIGAPIGGVLSAIGRINPVAAAAAVAIAGIGIASMQVGTDIDNMEAKVTASLGRVGKKAEDTSKAIEEAYDSGLGESRDQLADAGITIKQQNPNISNDELIKQIGYVETLNKLFGADYNESVRAATQLQKRFGMEGDASFDLIFAGFQNGLNKNGDFLDTINEYTPAFKAGGFSGEEMFSILMTGAEAGAWSIDKIGDAMKEFQIRAKDGSDTTKDGFKMIGLDANKMSKDIAAGGDKAKEAFGKTITALSEIEDPIKRNAAGVALFGTQWEDLESDVITSLDSSKYAVEDFATTAEDSVTDSKDTMSGVWTEVGRNFMDVFEPLGEFLNDMFKDMGEGVLEFQRLFGEGWEGIKSGEAWEVLKQTASDTLDQIGENWSTFWSDQGEDLDSLGTTLSDWWTKFKEDTAANLDEALLSFETFWTDLSNAWTIGMEYVKQQVSDWWTGVKDDGKAKYDEMIASFETFWTDLSTAWTTGMDYIKQQVSDWWTTQKEDAVAKKDEMIASLSTFWTDLSTAWTTGMDTIKQNIIDWWTGVKEDFLTGATDIGTSISTGFENAKAQGLAKLETFKAEMGQKWEDMKATASEKLNGLATNVSTAMENAKAWGVEKAQGFASGVSTAYQTAKDWVSQKASSIATSVSDAMEKARSWGVQKAQGFASGVSDAYQKAKDWVSQKVSSIATSVSDGMSKAKDWGVQKASAFATGVSDAFQKAKDWASDKISSIVSAVTGMKLKIPSIDGGAFTTILNKAIEIAGSIKSAFEGIKISIPKPSLPSIGISWGKSTGPKNSGGKSAFAWLPKFFATGGIVTGATQAVIGEAGDEAVVPLSNKTRMKPFANAVASMMPEFSGGGGISQVEVKPHDVILQLDGKTIARQTVKYNQQELEKQTLRNNRLSGQF